MDEQTLLVLLARFIKQSIADLAPTLPYETVDKFARQIAGSAWNGLIVLMRQMLANQGYAVLDEF